ncbi:MAG TPA: OmpH family outer membrane protein [Phycisphaerae bacterium]|nr:OmpH family outer membrane protein [Phycisphaerae bacterium]
MKRIALLVALSLPAGLCAADDGQSSPEIAVVNLAKVFDGYRMTKDLEQQFDDRRRAIGTEAENRRYAVEKQITALQAFDPSSADYAQRRDELRRMEFEFKVWVSMEEQRLKDEHMAWLRRIYDDVREVVADIARARGFDLILTYDELSPDVPDSLALRREILLKKVLYFSDRVDLTAEVLRSLNERYDKRGGAASLKQPPPIPMGDPAAPAAPDRRP